MKKQPFGLFFDIRLFRLHFIKQKTVKFDCLLLFAPEFLLSQAKGKVLRTLRMRRMPKTRGKQMTLR